MSNTPVNPELLGVLLALGRPLPAVTPIIVAALWRLVFTVVAVWRLGPEEF